MSRITLGKKNTTLSLHLQPKTMSYREILRQFLVPKITELENEPAEAMAIVTRWKNRRLTLDGSAALANAIFVQLERDFDAEASYENIKTQLLADEVELFKLLGVEEDLG